MTPTIREFVLAMGSSLPASIVAKATVIAAFGLMGARLARKSRAAVRHVLLAATFGVLLLLPVASLIVPPVRIAVPTVRMRNAKSVCSGCWWRVDFALHAPGHAPCGNVGSFAIVKAPAVCAPRHGLVSWCDARSDSDDREFVEDTLSAPVGSAVGGWAEGRR